MKLLLILLALLLSLPGFAREIDRKDYSTWTGLPFYSQFEGEGSILSGEEELRGFQGVGGQGGGDRTNKATEAQDLVDPSTGFTTSILNSQTYQEKVGFQPSVEQYDRVYQQMIEDGYLIWDPRTESYQPPPMEL